MNVPLRPDLALVASLVPHGSRVLDLGCGPGVLLRHLMDDADCTGTGVEIDPEGVVTAIRSGVPIIELDLDHELGDFADGSYDVVVLSRTLQTVRKPAEVLRQMARIAPRSIVTVPNFGYWRHRVRLARGRMPMSKELPFSWYDTPNLHHTTLVDLELLFTTLGLRIERRVPLRAQGGPLRLPDVTANWSAGAALYVLTSR